MLDIARPVTVEPADWVLCLEVENEEMERRRVEYQPPEPRVKRGYLKHYADQVAPATRGAVMPR